MEFVARAQVEGLNPGQQIVATQSLPAFQVVISDAAVVGVNQVKAAVAATAAGKDLLHPLHIGIE